MKAQIVTKRSADYIERLTPEDFYLTIQKIWEDFGRGTTLEDLRQTHLVSIGYITTCLNLMIERQTIKKIGREFFTTAAFNERI